MNSIAYNKVKVVVAGFGNATKEFLINNINNTRIEIGGYIPDMSVAEKDICEFVKRIEKQIPILEFTKRYLAGIDIIFTPEYRRIIPSKLCDEYTIINCHGGILPKWRGFSANAWAIMNGEDEVGFTLHRVRPGLDDGEIYYTKRIPITKAQTYGDVHADMIRCIVQETPEILYEIGKGILSGVKQPSEGFAYCTRFTKSMGDISSFTQNTDYYINLWRCMARPLGSGVWFNYKGERYEVNKIGHGRDVGSIDYIGIPGKIVNITEDKLWVKTHDNVVILSDIRIDGKKIVLYEHFRNGIQIGGK